MCDTRTWVFKLLIVYLIIHYSRIQQYRVAAAPPSADGVAFAVGGADVTAGAVSIEDDSYETTLSAEDTLSESQRSTLNSTYSSRKSNINRVGAQPSSSSTSSLLSSSGGSIANRLASDDGVVADGDEGPDAADDNDGSNEEFNESQRKFNNAAEAEEGAPSAAVAAGEISKTALVFGILKREENEKDYVGYFTPSPSTTEPTSVLWNGNRPADDDDDDDEEEDVDEILQPMQIPSSDKHHYNSNNGGRVMSYSMEYHPSNGNSDGNEESSGSTSFKQPVVTNRIKSGYLSAFEQHKALIRNSKRYGHKSHKKKYKDYLHYNPPSTTLTMTTTTISPLQKGILARDRIYNSDDIPRSYYQGHVNYYTNTDDYDAFHDAEKKDQTASTNFRSYHSPSYPRQHQLYHNGGHLRSGGRYRHIGVQATNQRPVYSSTYPDDNMLNYHHLGSRAKQQHQKELEKKINEYSQYYSKWPHLAQVEDQLFEDEQTDILYPEGDGTSDSNGELVLAARDDEGASEKDEEEDRNLPPYIKKYRRRNKQLLDLLEGTPLPSTPSTQWSGSILKPGPVEGSHQNSSPRHHLRQHRQHHHHRQHRNRQRSHRHKNSKWQIEDLFEEQRANPNNPNKTTTYREITLPNLSAIASSSSTSTTTTSTTTLSPFDELLKHEDEHLQLLQANQLPAEDVSISRELYDWAIEIGKDNDANDDEADDSVDHNSWQTNRNARPSKLQTTTTLRPVASVRRPNVYGSIMKSPPSVTATSTAKPVNSFVYHRVVEAPRVVGAGQTGRKQRLPFVAITDRRLETSKKGMGNAGVLARKDFEQNHFPMP